MTTWYCIRATEVSPEGIIDSAIAPCASSPTTTTAFTKLLVRGCGPVEFKFMHRKWLGKEEKKETENPKLKEKPYS